MQTHENSMWVEHDGTYQPDLSRVLAVAFQGEVFDYVLGHWYHKSAPKDLYEPTGSGPELWAKGANNWYKWADNKDIAPEDRIIAIKLEPLPDVEPVPQDMTEVPTRDTSFQGAIFDRLNALDKEVIELLDMAARKIETLEERVTALEDRTGLNDATMDHLWEAIRTDARRADAVSARVAAIELRHSTEDREWNSLGFSS